MVFRLGIDGFVSQSRFIAYTFFSKSSLVTGVLETTGGQQINLKNTYIPHFNFNNPEGTSPWSRLTFSFCKQVILCRVNFMTKSYWFILVYMLVSLIKNSEHNDKLSGSQNLTRVIIHLNTIIGFHLTNIPANPQFIKYNLDNVSHLIPIGYQKT